MGLWKKKKKARSPAARALYESAFELRLLRQQAEVERLVLEETRKAEHIIREIKRKAEHERKLTCSYCGVRYKSNGLMTCSQCGAAKRNLELLGRESPVGQETASATRAGFEAAQGPGTREFREYVRKMKRSGVGMY